MNKSGFFKLATVGGLDFAVEAARVHGVCFAQVQLWNLSFQAAN